MNRIQTMFFSIVILMFIIAAGDGSGVVSPGNSLASAIGWNGDVVLTITLLMSAWFGLLGLMCRRLEKIPGIPGKNPDQTAQKKDGSFTARPNPSLQSAEQI